MILTMRNLLLAILSLAATSSASAQPTIGWRTDGTGRYPKADPPKVWSPDKNVVWKTKLPNFSVASPIIVGDKIFVCSEPCGLLCVNKADGKILWEKYSSLAELPWTEDEKTKLAAEKKQDKIWAEELSALDKTRQRLQDEKDKAQTKKAIAAVQKEMEDLRAKRKSLKWLQRATEPGKNSTGGFSQCTPVWGGKHLYVGFGDGLVACYDLDGTRRWLRFVEHPTVTYGHGSSPALAGDKLIVHYADLVALDIKDGSESWRVKLPPNHGSPIATTIGDTNVVFTPTGVMLRAQDGKILADKLGSCGPNSPLLHDNIAYFIAGGAKAVMLPTSPNEQPESLWKANLKGGDYWFASPIVHDGLIYAINGNCGFSVLDAKSGKLVYFDKLDFGGRA